MGNCLKTQLKEQVQNDNLLKIGEIKFNVTRSNAYFNLWRKSDASVITAEYTDCNVGGSTSETITDNSKHNITVTGPNPKVSLSNKYEIVKLYFSGGKTDVGTLDYMSLYSLTLYGGEYYGNAEKAIESLTEGSSYNNLVIEGPVTGDISILGKKPASLSGINIKSQKITGTYNNIGYICSALETIFGSGTKNTNFDLIEFVKKARKKNITKDSFITFNYINGITATIDGTAIPSSVSTLKFKWDNSTITYNTGGEDIVINNNEVES